MKITIREIQYKKREWGVGPSSREILVHGRLGDMNFTLKYDIADLTEGALNATAALVAALKYQIVQEVKEW